MLAVLSLALRASDARGERSWKEAVAARLDRLDYSTSSPLIGVLTQPYTHDTHRKDDQTISGPLVSWIESAGGRVVPIRRAPRRPAALLPSRAAALPPL
jgi:hypothetical protein